MKLLKLFILLSFLIFTNSCSKKEEIKKTLIRPVNYEIVKKSNAEEVRTYNGVATASFQIELSFRTNGIITKKNIKVGQKVKKGQLLMKLDNVQSRLSYEQSKVSLNTALSKMNTVKSELERAKALFETGSYSLSKYDAIKNDFNSAKNNYESAKRKLEIDKSQIDYGFIYAPKNGVIASVNSNLNETVSPGQVIAVLNAGDHVNVTAGLPENIINKINVGMVAHVSFSALNNTRFLANVIEISPSLNDNSSTYPIKLDIPKNPKNVKPGMVADVTFVFQNKNSSDFITVPINAIGEDGDGNFVFVIDSIENNIGIAKKRIVKIGNLSNEGFSILEGLKENEKIATAGLQTLLDGQKVKLQ